MKVRFELAVVLLVFALAIFLGYVIYEADDPREHINKSVVVDGDTLKIVEWVEFRNLYVLENGLVFKYNDYENRNKQED